MDTVDVRRTKLGFEESNKDVKCSEEEAENKEEDRQVNRRIPHDEKRNRWEANGEDIMNSPHMGTVDEWPNGILFTQRSTVLDCERNQSSRLVCHQRSRSVYIDSSGGEAGSGSASVDVILS
uniref:Uncharacterized protein n=1 Tax=Angiostrongylus cantonensis TaxID=6313 RepID=A0A0K0DE82_ANGCA